MSTPGDAPLDAQVHWLPCPGCAGEIGVPPHWLAHTVACPKCGAIVSISEVERVLWRPPKSPAEAPVSRPREAIAEARSLAVDSKSVCRPIRWRVHARVWMLSLIAMIATGFATLAVSPIRGDEMSGGAVFLVVLASVSGFILGLLSLGCWGIVLVTMMRHNQTPAAIVLFLMLPIGYVLSYLYGWAKAGVLPIAKPMLVWSYCIALGSCLAVASVAATGLAANLFPDRPSFYEERAVALVVDLGGSVKRSAGSRSGLVEAVVLDGARVAERLEPLEFLGALKELSLNGCYLFDRDVRQISRFKRLKILRLNRARLPAAAAVSYLRDLPNLEVLELSGATLRELRDDEYVHDASAVERLRSALPDCQIIE